MNNNIIYFDNAATGYPKPYRVKKAVYHAFDEYGGNPGRSGHILSTEASKAVYGCREEVCELLNFNYPERVVFTLNATHALNIAIKGLAEKGSHIIISNLEHNSVYRPVYSLCSKAENEMTFSIFDATGKSDDSVLSKFESAIRDNTKLAVITAASNICGKILPIRKIADVCRKRDIKLIIDASQAIGVIDIDIDNIKPDVLCSAGHKGLYGPSGTGFAVFSPDISPETIIQGGNGIVSELPDMGNILPEMLEAGTVNTVGICGLKDGIRFIRETGIQNIEANCLEIDRYISENLAGIGAQVYSNFINKTPITLFNIPGITAEKVTELLDEKRICTRGGIHCSPLAHKALFTGPYGAVRASYGYANTMQEAKKFVSVIYDIYKNLDYDLH